MLNKCFIHCMAAESENTGRTSYALPLMLLERQKGIKFFSVFLEVIPKTPSIKGLLLLHPAVTVSYS